MESYKKYWLLSLPASIFLAVAAVWLGGLNQDEGWYLYAANLVSEGKMLYRDFFYTQGPLMPLVYSPFKFIWNSFGLVGARAFTSFLGFAGIAVAVLTVAQLLPDNRSRSAKLMVFALLACNLYHLYYLSIPKTYALASLFVALGYLFYARALASGEAKARYGLFTVSAALLAMAAGVRISLGLLLPVCGLVLLFNYSRLKWSFLFFGIGGFAGLLLVYGAFLCDAEAFQGLCAAQKYHAARGGFSPVLAVGSLSRLVRWYVPMFIIAGLAVVGGGVKNFFRSAPEAARCAFLAMAIGALSVIGVQMLAPCPYEDYQVPLMGLLTVACVVAFQYGDVFSSPVKALWLTIGLSFAVSFGSPLLEEWTDGQDRFWTLRKKDCEMALLRDAAREIERLDPGGKTLLTQDLYLAIETGRRVPDGLEMGPFSMLSDDEWRDLLRNVECPVAALSGYTFAIDPPVCGERPADEQIEFWNIVKSRYSYAGQIDGFGQNSTSLLLLKRDDGISSREAPVK
ncbi:MAG: hypothetical protein IKL02_01760 [Kiritimatiellae bacterium]|nr:hypothetical protein [Kiritimatiellia bacterium]